MGLDPVSWLVIGATTLSVAGSLIEGESAAQSSEWNAAMEEYQGEYAKQKASIDESILREDVSRTVGKARAVAGASGFALESMSTQEAIDDIVRTGELDAAMIRHQGDIGQWKAKESAEQLREQADAQRTAGYFGAGTSLLSGGVKFGEIAGKKKLAKKTV